MEDERDQLVKDFEKIKQENKDLREELEFLKQGQKAEKLRSSRAQTVPTVETQKLQSETNLTKSDGAPQQQESRRVASCAVENGSCVAGVFASGHSLSAESVRRYSRQLLVSSFGIAGQEKLLNSSILVIGMGGLGSPIALYLAASGVGKLGLVDQDIVELSNLHRQIIHTEAFIGQAKVTSAASACLAVNSSLRVQEYGDGINAANAVDIISQYDVVVDATDNLPTRYLISDACVAIGKPLVSGAALGVEGQLSVYNHKNGPCYRCLFPVPPPPGVRQRCSDNGVLGVVPGIIGTFQALEAIKIASGVGETLNSRMLLLDALSTRLHMVKIRSRNAECIACGDAPQIVASNLHQYDYEGFTESTLSEEPPKSQELIPANQRISPEEFRKHLELGKPLVLLDVRDSHEYAISSLPNSLNIPLSSLKEKLPLVNTAVELSLLQSAMHSEVTVSGAILDKANQIVDSDSTTPVRELPSIYVVCRRGNDSQKAVQLLRNEGFSAVVDVIGGLKSWARDVDKTFPFY